jgi:hypothetical protein
MSDSLSTDMEWVQRVGLFFAVFIVFYADWIANFCSKPHTILHALLAVVAVVSFLISGFLKQPSDYSGSDFIVEGKVTLGGFEFTTEEFVLLLASPFLFSILLSQFTSMTNGALMGYEYFVVILLGILSRNVFAPLDFDLSVKNEINQLLTANQMSNDPFIYLFLFLLSVQLLSTGKKWSYYVEQVFYHFESQGVSRWFPTIAEHWSSLLKMIYSVVICLGLCFLPTNLLLPWVQVSINKYNLALAMASIAALPRALVCLLESAVAIVSCVVFSLIPAILIDVVLSYLKSSSHHLIAGIEGPIGGAIGFALSWLNVKAILVLCVLYRGRYLMKDNRSKLNSIKQYPVGGSLSKKSTIFIFLGILLTLILIAYTYNRTVWSSDTEPVQTSEFSSGFNSEDVQDYINPDNFESHDLNDAFSHQNDQFGDLDSSLTLNQHDFGSQSTLESYVDEAGDSMDGLFSSNDDAYPDIDQENPHFFNLDSSEMYDGS